MARTPEQEAALQRDAEKALAALEKNPPRPPPRRRRGDDDGEELETDVIDRLARERNAAMADAKALRRALKQALAQIARSSAALEVEVAASAPTADEVRYGWTQDATISDHGRIAGVGRRMILRLTPLTKARRMP